MHSSNYSNIWGCNVLLIEQHKHFITFEKSAHYPQFEEKEKFNDWMSDTFFYIIIVSVSKYKVCRRCCDIALYLEYLHNYKCIKVI